MVKVGTIGFDLVAYTGGLTKPLRNAQRQVESFGRSIRNSIGDLFGFAHSGLLGGGRRGRSRRIDVARKIGLQGRLRSRYAWAIIDRALGRKCVDQQGDFIERKGSGGHCKSRWCCIDRKTHLSSK